MKSKTFTQFSLPHQLVRTLLVFALLWQPLIPLNGATAAGLRRTNSRRTERAASSPAQATDGFRQTGDATSKTPPAEDASGAGSQNNQSCPAATASPRAARLTYLGQFQGECGQPFAVAARLTDACGNALADRQLTFNVGGQSVSATTDDNGIARSSLQTPASPAPLPLDVNFAGDGDYSPAREAASATIKRTGTFIRYTGKTTLAVGVPEPVSAILTDATSGRPVRGAVVNFEVGSTRVSGTTGADGVVVTALTVPPAETFDRTQLKISFAGDECREPAATTADVTAYLRTSFVIWGGNSERLRLGQRVNFWGHSWAKQVTGGDYKAHNDFKGYADTVRQFQLCQVNARTTARPPLNDSCWSTKPGQSFPPPAIPEYIGVIVTTSADKSGAPDFGNIAALVVVKVDREPRYGDTPGKPGFGIITAVIADGEGVLGGSPSLSASQTQAPSVLPSQPLSVTLTVSNNSTAAAANVSARESFHNLGAPDASAEAGTLPSGGSQTRTFGATVPALPPRRDDESSPDYQRRLGNAAGTVYSSFGVVSFQDAMGRALPPVYVSSSSILQIPRLAVGISAPSCVNPGATVPYVVTLTNAGGATAASAAAIVTFADGTSTRVETTNLEAGKVFSATVNWKVPVVAAKGAAESDADYLARLASFDGKLLKTTASATWRDALGNVYGAVEQECDSVERVPVLSQTAPAPPPMLPGQRVTLPAAVRNAGSAPALQAKLRATNPDSTVFDAAPFSLAAGSSSNIPTTLAAPAVAPKEAGETDAAYLDRLRSADNRPIDFTLALEWADATGNLYGPIAAALRTTEVLPIILLSLSGPETVESGETITYQVSGNNAGHAEAVSISLNVTLPGGRVEQVTLPGGKLAPGGTQAAVINFTVPATQAEGQISAQASVNWKDAWANGYGPASAIANTNVLNPNRPPQVNAGPDLSVVLPAAVTLNGTASDDGKPSGSTLAVGWTKVSGPGEVSFGNPNQTVTTAAFSVEGVYVLRLAASDSVLSASDEATVNVTPPPTGPTYGDDADLSDCKGVNIVCDENKHLSLNNEATPFNFIWVAVSSKGTIVKLDTDTGKVMGEYFSSPNGQPRNPSRTTVDHNGNVWASNRDGNSVLRIGLAENGQCVDRNGNGVIDTSQAQNDIRAWTNAGGVDTDGGVETAADECIINYTRVRSSGTRHVSVNVLNDVWVSGTGGARFDLLDGVTGQIKRQEGPVGYGGYGGLIDKKGVIWSARPLLRWDTALPLKGANAGTWKGYSHDSYGLCIDSKDNVWNTALDGNLIYKFAPDGTLLGTFNHGSHWAQGCVVDRNDHVWVAHSLHTSTVGRLKNDGTWIGNVPVGSGPTGVAVDVKGKIWATNHNSRNVSRIDPELGPMGADGETRVGQVDLTTVDLKGNLYNYSDMTGSTLSGAPASGTWTQVFDSGIDGAEWGVIGWDGRLCGDASLVVTVSSSADAVSFSAPVAVTNGGSFSVPRGRHLRVNVVFKRASSGESPFLFNLTVGTKGYKLPLGDNPPPDVDAGTDQTATMPNAANLAGSACDSGRVSGLAVSWEKVSGPGAVTFANAKVPATSATFGEAGEYTLRLTVKDANLSATDEMTVLILPFNDPPKVSAGDDQTLILPAAANLKGTVSDDALPVNSSVAAYWSKLSGPGEVTFTNNTSPTASASFSQPGVYLLRLTGDDSQFTNVDDLTVTVHPPNAAPAVSAGDDLTIRLPDKANLGGAVTDDGLPLGKTVTVNWAKVSGPGTVSFAKASAAATTAGFSLPGVYVLRLTATDTQLSASDELTVIVNPANQPPTVSAGDDLTITLPDAANLRGSYNDDDLPEGASVAVAWSKVSGPGIVTFGAAQSAETTVAFSEAGTYVLRLTASDSALSRADDLTVTVNPSLVNLPPNVNAGADQSITLPAKANLAGIASDDRQPAGSTLTVAWSKASGPGNVTFGNAAVATTTAAFSVAGMYVLRLAASDSDQSAADEINITVLPVNQPPVVKAGTDQIISYPSAVNLTGTATDDGQPAGGRLTVAWSKASGPGEVSFADAGVTATSATFSTGGKYVLRLTASDSVRVSTDDVAITVNEAPTAEAGEDLSIYLPNAVNLKGAVTDDALPPGKTIVVVWSKVSGPGTVAFASPAVANTTATFGEAGTYVLRLTANDSLLSDADELTVTVNPPLPPPPSVAINSPVDGAEISARAEVTGSVSHGSWKLEYSLGPDPLAPDSGVWTTFATGVTPAANAALGIFDPTLLLNGTYSIRLTATDADGRSASVTRKVVVAGQQKLGNFTVSFEDLAVPVAGLPIQLTRTYDSRDKRTGDFGVGWTLAVKNVRLEKSVELGRHWRGIVAPGTLPQYCLQPSEPNIVTITFPDGRVYKFQATTTRQCQAIVPIEVARFGFTPMPGTRGTLVPEAPIDVLVAGGFPGPIELLDYSNDQLPTYDPTLFRFTDENGMVFVIDQKLGVRSIADPNGNKLTINRDGIIHSSGKSVSFTRDALGRITRITDPSGNALTYAYDGNGDLTVFRDRENNQVSFTYDARHYLLSYVDPRGIQPARYDYDDSGRLTRVTDAFGKVINFTHDLAARREVTLDRSGHATAFDYNARGMVVRVTDPSGGVTTRTYDGRDNLLSETDPLGGVSTYTYDAQDNLLSRTGPLGQTTRYTYNSRGQTLTVTDPQGGVTTNTYDAKGNPLAETDPLGATTSYAYDTSGNLVRETDPVGHVTTTTFDANNNALSETETRTVGGVTQTLTTTYEYDRQSRPVKTTGPDGSTAELFYDSIGKVSASVAAGRRTRYEYDELGRQTSVTYQDGTKEFAGYDPDGRRTKAVDRAGRTTLFTYDPLGRPASNSGPDGSVLATTYDAAGRVVAHVDARGNRMSYEYDAAGQVTKLTDALGNATVSIYDAAGRRTSATDAKGQTTTFEYDAAGNHTKTIHPDGTSTATTYDTAGRETAKTDQAGRTTHFEYDKADRLLKVTDALGGITRFAYSEAGELLAQTNANGHTTTFEYDRAGRRIKRTLPLGMSETYAYDLAGNMVSRTNFHGYTATYAYDSMNRLVRRTPDARLNESAMTLAYTPTGARASMTDAAGQTTYAYDARDRLLSVATPQGTLTYAYDATGNLLNTRSSNADGVRVDYAYDARNRLTTVTDNRLASAATTYAYDANSNLSSVIYPNGVQTTYAYDQLNRLTQVGAAKAGASVARYAYTLAPTGQRLSVAEQNGRTVNYSYDALYRLTGEAIGGDAATNGSINYTHDAVGNRLSRTSTVRGVAAQSASYDANDRNAADSHDPNGNTIVSNNTSYTYDSENRLTSAGGVSYVYDGDGHRVAKTEGGVTTRYLVDPNNPTGFAQTVEELQGGRVVRQYTYGHDLISQRQLIGGQWRVSFYGYDGHGSVRYLTDDSGVVTDTYTYDAFGTVIARTGDTPNEYLYAGERFDAGAGFYYLRARYMNPATGRFQTMDSYEGRSADPSSLHKYLYAAAEPVANIDPSGEAEFTLSGLKVAFSVQGVLVSMSINAGFATIETVAGMAAGAGLRAASLNATMGLLQGMMADVVLGGVVPFLPLVLKAARRVKAGLQAYRAARPATSIWRLGWGLRGLEIEMRILGRKASLMAEPFFPVIDDFTKGIATSIKSLDLVGDSYQDIRRLRRALTRYAEKLSKFKGAAKGDLEVLEEEIKERVLLMVFENGAGTAAQLKEMGKFLRQAEKTWPDIKVIFAFID
jgi:RHS repeat-associated protein